MKTSVEINPNARIKGNETFAGFEDVYGPMPCVGQDVGVFERESGLIGWGRITAADPEARLLDLWVDWANLTVPSTRGWLPPLRTQGLS